MSKFIIVENYTISEERVPLRTLQMSPPHSDSDKCNKSLALSLWCAKLVQLIIIISWPNKNMMTSESQNPNMFCLFWVSMPPCVPVFI